MTNVEQLTTLQAQASLLHAVLALYPSAETLAQLQQADFRHSWPRTTGSTHEQRGLALIGDFLQHWQGSDSELTELKLEYGELFYGPGTPKAPLWGSVYRSATQLLNDSSTMVVKAFFDDHGIEIHQQSNEPVDHLGTFIAVIAHLLQQMQDPQDNDAEAVLVEMLQEQLLPWAYRCLTLAQKHARSGYYQGMALLCAEYLRQLQHHFAIRPKVITLYL